MLVELVGKFPVDLTYSELQSLPPELVLQS